MGHYFPYGPLFGEWFGIVISWLHKDVYRVYLGTMVSEIILSWAVEQDCKLLVFIWAFLGPRFLVMRATGS